LNNKKYMHFSHTHAHTCICKLQASLLSTYLQNDRNVATLEMEYQTMLYLSSANYKMRNYRMACNQLEDCVLQHKTMLRYKSSHLSAIEVAYSQFQDVELRYRIAVCYKELGEYNMAISTLQAVKSRTPRLNMLLAKLLHQHGGGNSKSETKSAFKDVLRECPMSLTSIEALIELGTDGSEVHSMVVNRQLATANNHTHTLDRSTANKHTHTLDRSTANKHTHTLNRSTANIHTHTLNLSALSVDHRPLLRELLVW